MGIYYSFTKYCQVWQIMVITEHFIAEFMVFKLIIQRIQGNIHPQEAKLTEFGCF